ncbi:MAG TPA: nucleotidyltransferase family protein [Acidimicrobiia bacterium]|jgi:CTP:molybdopterin cytidylyltransferase MocA
MSPSGRVAAAVLAAGRGSRLDAAAASAKPLLSFRGRPLVAHALDAAVTSALAPVVLVVGHEADAVSAVAPEGVQVVHNDRWADGISSSLHAALRALEPEPADGVVIGLADQPLVGAEAWRRIGAAYTDGATLAVATYGAKRGNPVLLARTMWPDALELRGDEGARQLFRDHEVVEVPCDGTGSPDDVDTLQDLERIERIS